MIHNPIFQSAYSSIKDTGITLYEVQVLALGSRYGDSGAGGINVVNTLLGTFSTASLGVPMVIANQTGADVAAAFSGTFKNAVNLNDALLPEDIKLGFRVTTATGVSKWHYIHFEAICPPAEVVLTLSAPDGMTTNQQKQNWKWEIQAQRGDGSQMQVGDFILLEIIRSGNVIAYANVPIGGDPTDPQDIPNEFNWNNVTANDTNIGTYLTLNASFSSLNLFNGNTELYFAKKLWATAIGYAGINAGENITIRVTAVDASCNQTPTPDEGVMTPIIFAEIFLPFVGKQSAGPYPEYRYPLVNPVIGGSLCSGSEWWGFSLRNGALTSPISEIRINTDGNIDTFNTDNSPIHFPLPPLTHGDTAPSCSTPLNNLSTPLIGFDMSAYFTDPLNAYNKGITSMIEEANGHIRPSLEIDFDVPYYGTVTVNMNFSMAIEATNADDPNHKDELWSFDNTSTSILIVRGDAAVYGNNTAAVGLAVNLAFNVNNTRVANTGAANWTANTKVQISQTAGLAPGAFDEYDIISPPGPDVTGSIPTVPNLDVDADSININHMFPAEGIYYIKIVVETDASPDGKVFKSEAEGYLMVASS